MDPIEAEARAFAEAWPNLANPRSYVPIYGYLAGLIAALDARDAEIARLTEQNHFFQVQYQDEAGINALSEQLVAAKAEIARLRAPPGADAATNIDKAARALLIADDGGNADAILAATDHAGDCPFVGAPASYTCSKCQADHYRELAHAVIYAIHVPPGSET